MVVEIVKRSCNGLILGCGDRTPLSLLFRVRFVGLLRLKVLVRCESVSKELVWSSFVEVPVEISRVKDA